MSKKEEIIAEAKKVAGEVKQEFTQAAETLAPLAQVVAAQAAVKMQELAIATAPAIANAKAKVLSFFGGKK